VNFLLDSGGSIKGRLVDPDGRPLSNAHYSGKLAQYASWDVAQGDTFDVVGYSPDQPRRLLFYHPERRLAGVQILQGQPPADLVVKLQLAGKAEGRLVDANGEPLAGMALVPWSPPISSPGAARPASGIQPDSIPLPPNVAHSRNGQHATDQDGRFAIDGLVPGVEYAIRAFSRAGMTPERFRAPVVSGRLEKLITVEPGQTIDLGDVRIDATDETAKFAARPAAAKLQPRMADVATRGDEKSTAAPSRDAAHQFKGRITGPDGKLGPGVDVALIGYPRRPSRGGDDNGRSEVLAETKTDASGNYELKATGLSSQAYYMATLVASTEGAGIAWQQIDLDAATTEASFQLAAEEPIRARLVDIEGQPAAGVEVTFLSVMPKMTDDKYNSEGVGFMYFSKQPAVWPRPVTTDATGRFTIRNVAAAHGVALKTSGTDRFAPQDLALNTGMPEQRGERDATYRSLVKNGKPGEELVLSLAPAQIFEGVVRYADSGKPAPNARLSIWASQQEFGSMLSVAGKADEQGRYRVHPNPGIRFGITAYPPDGTAYLTRRLPPINWQGGETRKQVDIELPPGILVRGTIVETQSGAPIANASVQYIPEADNNPNAKDDILTGWQGIQLSNADGEFEIAALPGPGRLLVHATDDFVLVETSSGELRRGRAGGERNYAHAVERINPQADAEPIAITIKLQRGDRVSGRIVDEDGQLADHVLMISRTKAHASSIFWRGQVGYGIEEVRGGQFELRGLAAGKDNEVYFLDAERRLGAKVTIRADGDSPTVVLKPCGSATAIYVDRDGKPIANAQPMIEFVAAPGAGRYEMLLNRAALTADADFMANVDRTNYSRGPKTDAEGRITFPALIPGATYRVVETNGQAMSAKTFSVKENETVHLGTLKLDSGR
jgi:protocatechuate 3,4-dioxygenase beta subunit